MRILLGVSAAIVLGACGSPGAGGAATSQSLWASGGRWVTVGFEPSPARVPTAMVWDGSDLLLWGGLAGLPTTVPTAPGGGYPPGYPGYTGTPALDGFSYNPAQHRWGVIPPAPLPFPGLEVSSAWTGRYLIIWGFDESTRSGAVGALYDPSARKWTPMAKQTLVATGSGVWTGTEWIVVGEDSTAAHAHAAAYQPSTDTWRPLPDPPSLNGPEPHQVLTWTGKTLLFGVPAGLDHALAFDPIKNQWTGLAPSPAGALSVSVVAWTGDDLLLAGGSRPSPNSDVATPAHVYAVYHPVTDTWSRVALPPSPVDYGIPVDHRALFPGQAITPTLTYDPATDSWSTFPTPPGTVIVWTGHDLWSVGRNRTDRNSAVLSRYEPGR